MEIAYYIFLFPLEWIMDGILAGGVRLTGSYGIAIILLSLTVNVLLLPFYAVAERWKTAEAEIRARMEPELASIRRHYRGYEQHLLIKTVYRRFGYRPIYALRVSAGFLIQVPFFFAAYNLLSHYPALSGEAFGFIADLGRPDGLIAIREGRINVLPFVMTVINLGSAALYARNMTRSDLAQLWGLAFIFLLALYESAAGLVLYWTLNNVFSVFKTVVIDRRAASVAGSAEAATTPSWLDRQSRGVILVWMQSIVLVFAIYMLAVSKAVEVESAFYDASAALIAVAGLISVALLIVFEWRGGRPIQPRDGLLGLTTICAVVFAAVWVVGSKFYFDDEAMDNARIVVGSMMLAAAAHFARVAMASSAWRRPSAWPMGLMAAASIYIGAVVFVFQPLLVYSTAPDALSIEPGTLVVRNLPYALALAVALFGIGRVLGRWTGVFDLFLIFAALTFTLHASIVPYPYGAMDKFTLTSADVLVQPMHVYIGEFVVLLALFALVIRFNTERGRRAMQAMVVAILVLSAGQAALAVTGSIDSVARERAGDPAAGDDPTAPVLAFSKNGENIVVLMLDMFTGGLVKTILEEHPELRDTYDGFVWYPNTLSVSKQTNSSIPAINAGWRYTPERINERRPESLLGAIVESYDWLFATVEQRAFEMSVVDPSYYHRYFGDCSRVRARGMGCANSEDFVGPEANQAAADMVGDNVMLALVGMLKVLPVALKPFLYDGGRWRLNPGGMSMYAQSRTQYAVLASLAQRSIAIDGPSRFKYIQNNYSHPPHVTMGDCRIGPPASGKWDTISSEATYNAAKCALLALGRWLERLQRIGIYDRTKIVIVSDHGSKFVDDPMIDPRFSDPEIARGETAITDRDVSHLHALMLVKDFRSRGPLRTDDRFLSNADTASIFCRGLGGCDGIADDPTVGPPQPDRRLETIATKSWTWRHVSTAPHFDIRWKATVTGSIFDFDHWRRER